MDITTEINPFDLVMPAIPPRSRLYHLEPIGIGTAHVESLTSFIMRLAAAHHISVASLYRFEFEPHLRSMRECESGIAPKWMSLPSIYLISKKLNGMNSIAACGAKVLEALTLRQNLSLLTCVPWGTAVSAKLLVRKTPAWCPECYDEWGEGEDVIHSPLSWALNEVTMCIRHERPLEQRCPRCTRHAHFLAFNARAGRCSRCQFWLGSKRVVIGVPGEAETLRYRLWAAKAVGDWIEAAQKAVTAPTAEMATRAIVECIYRLANGNAKAFARLTGVETDNVYRWQAGKGTPCLEQLLRICFALGLSLMDFLTGRLFADGEFICDGPLGERVRKNSAKLRRDAKMIRLALERALEEEPAPSIHEIAARLDYQNPDSLRQIFPELCKNITARYKQSERGKSGTIFQKLCDDETVRNELEKALEQECPPAIRKIAPGLGYKSSKSLYEKFPELCKRITVKRAAYRLKLQSHWRTVLEAALKETPPPSLGQLLKRLGNLHPNSLRGPFPELCRAIMGRYAEWKEACSELIATNLQAALEEEPPLPLKQVALRHGYHVSDLKKRHPELCRMIVERYLAHQRKCVKENERLFRDEIRRVVLELHRQGLHPSKDRVSPLLGGTPVTSVVTMNRTLRELRRELGLPDRDQRSLARH